MVIAGNCSYIDHKDEKEIMQTAKELVGIANYFRCKLWAGGTVPEKYAAGIGENGIPTLKYINDKILPTGTEVQLESHICLCELNNFKFIWCGARNSQNYGLQKFMSNFYGDVMLKRGFGMTIDETIGMYDIMKQIHKKHIYIIERGVTIFDRKPESRWSPDLKGVIEIKHKRPDIFERLVVDCSHSVFKKEYIKDCYDAFKSIGVQHFMFECSANPEKARTDKEMCLSVKELKEIIK